MPRPSLPTGTVTFLFTDIEGSTNLVRTLGPRWTGVLGEHNEILRSAIRGAGGTDVRTEGDAFFAVFPSASGAVVAAATAQRLLGVHPWPEDGEIRVRMGLHTGEGRLGGDEYVGLDVHRAARIAAAAHGGQVLVSEATRALVADSLPDGLSFRDLGDHRLKDFDQAQRIHQLVIDGLPADFPALRTRGVPSTLPVQVTTFVGRQKELAKLDQLLAVNRLLTLVGPGGTGKTRLAAEAARRNAERHPDGVFFVDLSPISDPALVASSIVQALGLKEQPGRSTVDILTAHLADRRARLILDNFEQVVDAAPLVADLLRAAPAIAVLVTSRIRLDLAGEQAFPVPPLGVPPDSSDPEALASNEAVALFRDRARAVQPGFEITADNARSVARVCARLDGLPLAIELAAAQIRVLSPSELLERLQHRLPLRTGARDVPERQRTLRATIEWSYRLLDGPERKLFGRLSVFAGGAGLDAIEAVCNPSGDLEIDTLDGLASLFDASLLRRQELPEGSRFSMLETIRDHARDRLRTDFDAEETHRRHAEFIATLAEEWGPKVRGNQVLEANTVLSRDHDNIRAAIEWSLGNDRADLGVRIVGPMWMFWVGRGHLAEGKRAVEAVLALPSAAASREWRSSALRSLGALAYWEMEYGEAARAYGEALDLIRRSGDIVAIARARNDLVYAILAGDQPDEALPLIEESLRDARGAGDAVLTAEVLGLLGIARSQKQDYAGALEVLQESLTTLEDAGQVGVWAGELRGRIGVVLRMLGGRLEEAEEYIVSSLRADRRAVNTMVASAVSRQLGAIAWDRGDRERALRLFGFSAASAEQMGGAPPGALMLVTDPLAYKESALAEMDREAVERLWSEGAAMSLDEAISYAIGES
jgi:predicted ATPase/class 3 adenylate cyclase